MTSAHITLLILVVAIILFFTEKVPLVVTALSVPVALTLTKVLTPPEAYAGLSNNNVILFAGMFVIGHAFFVTGMANKVGNAIMKLSGKSEKGVVLLIMIVAAALSSVLANTSTAAVLMPVGIALAATLGIAPGKVLLPLAFAAGLGGMISLVGTPPNLIARSALEAAGAGTFGFFEFGLIGIPLTIAGILYMVFFGIKLIPNRGSSDKIVDAKATSSSQVPLSTTKQLISVLVLVGTILAMVFEKSLGVPIHVSAVIGALVIVATKIISEKEAFNAIDWTTIFLFAGMLPLATALDTTGAGKMIADTVIGAMGQNASAYVITAGLFVLVCGLTQFMSNTAAAALLAPIGISIAQGVGADPRAVVMTIAIAASCAFATPLGTPPNTLVYGPSRLKFYDYAKVGGPLIIVMFIVAVILIPLIWPFF